MLKLFYQFLFGSNGLFDQFCRFGVVPKIRILPFKVLFFQRYLFAGYVKVTPSALQALQSPLIWSCVMAIPKLYLSYTNATELCVPICIAAKIKE